MEQEAELKALVVDADSSARALLREELIARGHEVMEASSAKAAFDLIPQEPAIVLLELDLPDMDGLDFIRMVRARSELLPILVLSNRGDPWHKVRALDLGADNYMTKPCGVEEVLARMRVAMRHRPQVACPPSALRFGDLSVDLHRRLVKARDIEVQLTPKEYDLLGILIMHPDKVLTYRFLVDALWGQSTNPQYVRCYVRQLRQKLEVDPEHPQKIVTEARIGYRFKVEADERSARRVA